MFRYAITLIFTLVVCVACSQTVKGPVSGKKYNVNVGGYKDKTEYEKARKEATKPAGSECQIVDCPEPGVDNLPY